MEDSAIKIIIKAPNQNVDDQTIDCRLDWTVEKLKNHLCEVYPNNPDPKEQKIIYSGRLLRDHLQLKDVIRLEDRRSSVHTFHLVCSRQSNLPVPDYSPLKSSQPPSMTSDSEAFSDDSDDQDYTDSSQRSQSRTSTPTNDEFPLNDPLQDSQSFAQGSDVYNQMMFMSQMYMNYIAQHGQSFGNQSFSSCDPPNPVPPEVAAQMASYQQMFTNYYYQNLQNFQMFSNQFAGQGVVNPGETIAAAAAAGVRNPPNRNVLMNAQGGHVIDDENEIGNRDWLDYFYLCCRGFVLFSIVYFYSSPERLILVIGLAFLALLYQEGWILARDRNNRHNENRVNRARPRPQNPENHDNADDPSARNDETNERDQQNINEIEAIMDGDDPPHARNRNVPTNHNPAWTFISSFFSSLIPEPPAPVNIN